MMIVQAGFLWASSETLRARSDGTAAAMFERKLRNSVDIKSGNDLQYNVTSMAIIINLERHVGERNMSVTELPRKLASRWPVSSVLKNSKAL